ncbi:MAG TPA: NAD-binding protein, partial [bacterium]|nr:NAD-binding protein [bacterium]
KVRQALLGGFAQSRILEAHGQRMLDRNFKPGFKVRLHQKDLNIALSTGKALAVPLPATAVVAEAFTALRGLGRGDLDHSSLVTLIEDLAKVEVR